MAMLGLNLLPADICAMIFENLLSRTVQKMDTFKRQLPMLHFCQRWRALALPIVYRNAYFSIKWVAGSLAGNAKRAKRKTGKDIGYMNIVTNIDLIAANGYANVIRSIKIELYCERSPVANLVRIVEYLENIPTRLRIKHFEISIRKQYFSKDIIDSITKSKLADISQAIAKHLPDVKSIKLFGMTNNCDTAFFLGQLTVCYKNQLQSIHSYNTLNTPVNSTFQMLENVVIHLDDNPDQQIPQMLTDSLKSLCIENIAGHQLWNSFVSSNKSADIVFPKLQKLSLSYKWIMQTTHSAGALQELGSYKFMHKLVFPKLQMLTIGDSVDNNSILERMVLPKHVSSISIYARSPLYAIINKIGLPSTDSLHLCVEIIKDNTSGITCMNKILNNASNCQSLALTFTSSDERMAIDYVTCTALTKLRVKIRTSTSTLVALLERLPNLVDLTLNNISTDGYDDVIKFPAPTQHAQKAMTPLHCKLKKLLLDFRPSSYWDKKRMYVVVYILLRLPTIAKFISPSIQDEVYGELEKYKCVYPHINSVFDGFILFISGTNM